MAAPSPGPPDVLIDLGAGLGTRAARDLDIDPAEPWPCSRVPGVCRGGKAGPHFLVPSERGAGKDFLGPREEDGPGARTGLHHEESGVEAKASPSRLPERLATASKCVCIVGEAAEWACGRPATYP